MSLDEYNSYIFDKATELGIKSFNITSISREGLISENKNEVGGLSGNPINKRSNEIISYISKKSNKVFPIIGVGGIMSPEDAVEKIKSGADLVQIYTGFIYKGPSLIKSINKALVNSG